MPYIIGHSMEIFGLGLGLGLGSGRSSMSLRGDPTELHGALWRSMETSTEVCGAYVNLHGSSTEPPWRPPWSLQGPPWRLRGDLHGAPWRCPWTPMEASMDGPPRRLPRSPHRPPWSSMSLHGEAFPWSAR